MDDTIKMKDIIKIGNIEEIKHNFDFMEKEVESLIKEIRKKDVRNKKIIVLNNTAMKLMEYLKLYKTCIEYDMEILGFLTRNLFELDLTVRFVLKNENNLKQFISELFSDRKDIYEGLMSLSENRANNSYAILANQVKEIEEMASDKGYELKRPTKVFKMAEEVDVLSEYKAFYKFYSKYSHPTSFSINGDPNEKDSLEYRNILIVQAQKYLGSIFFIIKRELENHNNCEE